MLGGQTVDELSGEYSPSFSAGADGNEYRQLVLTMIEKMHCHATRIEKNDDEEEEETSTLGFLGELTLEQARELSTADLLAKVGELSSEFISSTSKKEDVWTPWWESFASAEDQAVEEENEEIHQDSSSWMTTVSAICFYLVLHRRCKGVWCDVDRNLFHRLLNSIHTAVTDLHALIRMVQSVLMLELDFAEPLLLDQMRSDAVVIFSNAFILKEAISQLSTVSSNWKSRNTQNDAFQSSLKIVGERISLAFESFQTEPAEHAVHTLHLEMDEDHLLLADDFSRWNPLDVSDFLN